MKRIWFLVAGVVLVLGLGVGLVLGTGKNVQNPVDNGEINTDIDDGTEEQDEALVVNDDESDFVFEYMTLDEYKNDWGTNWYDQITYYDGDEDIAIIVGVKDNAMMSDVVIPSFVVYNDETYRVGAIDEYAFAINVRSEFVHIDYLDGGEWEGEQTVWDNNETIKTVTIPATLDFVEYNAFRGCVAVEKIYLKERSTPIYNDFLWTLSEELVAKELNISLNEFWHESGNGQNEDNIKDAYGSVYNSLFNKDPSEPNLYYLGDKNKPYSYLCMYYDPSFDWNEEWGGLDDFSATVNSGCKVIGDLAFDSYPLTGVTLPSGLKVLENGAFLYTKLTSVSIPSSVTIIDWGAFDTCEALLEVTFEENSQLKIIQGFAFNYCTSLETIELPEGVKEIGEGLFYGCENLTSISIPSSVTSIGENAFEECYSIEEITLYGELLEEYELDSLFDVSNLTAVTILGDYVPYGALCGCSSLESVTLPFVGASADATEASESTLLGYVFGDTYYDGSVEVTQDYGFDEVESRCGVYYIPESLTSVTILGGNILFGAFSGNIGLTSLTIGSGVTRIGEGALYGCSSLQSLTLPFVGESADATEASALTDFGYVFGSYDYGEANQVYNMSMHYHVWKIPRSLTKVTILGGAIMENAFWDSLIQEIIIGDGVTEIGFAAFCESGSLEKVTIGSGVRSIGEFAFQWCVSLTTVIFSEGSQLESVGDYAFDICGITTIKIPNIEMWLNISFGEHFANPFECDVEHVFIGENEITELVIPNGITEIKNGAFSGWDSLTSVTIPSGVTKIGDGAFSGCSGLTSITIPNSVTSIGSYAFQGCSSLTSITIPDGVTSIGSYAFRDCYVLAEVYNKSSLNITAGEDGSVNGYVGTYARVVFGPNDNYQTRIVKDEENSVIYCVNDDEYIALLCYDRTKTNIILNPNTTEINQYAFRNCGSLASITIPSGVTSIGSCAFSGCSSLTSITIPEGVTSIGEGVFYGCSNLTTVNFGDNSLLASIGDFAFYNCSKLNCITIPSNVISIGSYAFSGCSNLTNVTFINPNGWFVASSSTATSGTNLNSSNLSSTSTAATYLKSTYYNKHWKRNS